MICVARTLRSIRGGEILDAGCGTGEFTRRLAALTGRPRSVLGIDPDKDSIDEARRLTDDRRIRYRVVDLFGASFPGERFDTVAMSNALHHMPNPALALGELQRVLRHDGVCVVRESVADNLTPAQENAREVHLVKARIDSLHGRTHRETYSSEAVVELVRQAGLRVIDQCLERGDSPKGRTGGAAGDGSALRETSEFLDDYLTFAEGFDEYAELSERIAALKARIARLGLSPAPHLVILALKPAAQSAGA